MAIRSAGQLGEAFLTITSDTTSVIKALSQVHKHVEKLGRQITDVGWEISKIGGVITGAFSGLAVAAIKTFSEIDQQLTEAKSIAAATAEEWQKVVDVVERLGTTTQYSQREISSAVRIIASAGYHGATVMDPLIANATALASAIGGDLPDAIGIAISAMESFSFGQLGEKTSAENIQRVVQLLSAVQAASRVEMRDLQFFMYQLSGLMAARGLDPKPILAAFGAIMQTMGNGRRAATSLRQALDMLYSVKAESHWADVILPTLIKFGYTADDINPKLRDIAYISSVLLKTGLLDAAEATKYWGTEGLKALQLIGNQQGKVYKEVSTRMDGVNSTFQRQAENINTVAMAWRMLKNIAESTLKAIGEGFEKSGVKRAMFDLRDILMHVWEWTKKHQEEIADWITKGMTLGVLLTSLGVSLMALGKAISFVGALISPAGLVWIVVFTSMATWVKKNYGALKDLVPKIQEVKGLLQKGDFEEAWKAFSDGIEKVFPKFDTLINKVKMFADALGKLMDRFMKPVKGESQRDTSEILKEMEVLKESYLKDVDILSGKEPSSKALIRGGKKVGYVGMSDNERKAVKEGMEKKHQEYLELRKELKATSPLMFLEEEQDKYFEPGGEDETNPIIRTIDKWLSKIPDSKGRWIKMFADTFVMIFNALVVGTGLLDAGVKLGEKFALGIIQGIKNGITVASVGPAISALNIEDSVKQWASEKAIPFAKQTAFGAAQFSAGALSASPSPIGLIATHVKFILSTDKKIQAVFENGTPEKIEQIELATP